MLKLIYVLMCFVCVSGLYSQSLDLIFHNSYNTLISDVAIAKDSTLVINTCEKLSDTEFEGKVFRSTDLGRNWELIWKKERTADMEPFYTYYWNYISAISKDTIVLFNSSGYISRTYDGGNNWDSTYVGDGTLEKISAFKKKKNQIAYIFNRSDIIIYSNDYGLSWDSYLAPTMQYFPDPITIMLEGEDRFSVFNSRPYVIEDKLISAVVRDSYDSGNWINHDTLYNYGIDEVYKLKTGDVLAFSSMRDTIGNTKESIYSYILYDKSFNFKDKWQSKDITNRAYWKPTIATYGETILVTCNDTIWSTNDDGSSWFYIEKDLLQPFYGTRLNGVDILDNGFGLYKDDKSVYLYNPNPTSVEELSEKDNTISIFPNPSAGIFTVTNEESELQDIRVFDSQGNEVGNLDVSSRSQDLSYLSSGTYFLRFNYKDKVKIRQIVINR